MTDALLALLFSILIFGGFAAWQIYMQWQGYKIWKEVKTWKTLGKLDQMEERYLDRLWEIEHGYWTDYDQWKFMQDMKKIAEEE